MYKEQLEILKRFEEDLENGWDDAFNNLYKSFNLKIKDPQTPINKVIRNAINTYYNAYDFIEDTTGAEDSGLCGIIRSNQVNLLIELLEELKEHEQENKDFYISYEAMGILKRYVLDKIDMEQVQELAKEHKLKYIKLPQALLFKEYVKGL